MSKVPSMTAREPGKAARQPAGSGAGRRVKTQAAAETVPKPQTRTQRERRSEAEARLLQAALETLARKGWAGTTLAEVGEMAGYSRGLASHYFRSKAGLLQAVTLKINDSFMAEVASRPATVAGLETVISFMEAYLGRRDPHWTNTRVILVLLTGMLLEGSENATQMIRFNASMFSYLEDNIRIGIKKGEIHPSTSPAIAAEFVVGLLRGTMLQRLVKGGRLEVATMSRHLTALVRRSLAAPDEAVAGRPGASVRPRRNG